MTVLCHSWPCLPTILPIDSTAVSLHQDHLEGFQEHRLQVSPHSLIGRFGTSGAENFGEGNGTPLQYSCLSNPMDGKAWQAAVHGVAKSRTRLSDFTFTFHFRALEKEMATHSSVLGWRIPEKGEPGRCCLWGHTESDTTEVTQQQQQQQDPWRRQWHPTPVLLPGKSHGRRSLVGYSP